MRKITTFFLLSTIGLLFTTQVVCQIKGLFDKEAPEFRATVIPTQEEGTVKLVFYFTHSKVTSLEGSIWLKDQGTSLSGAGENRMIRGLQSIHNRQQDTLLISGLKDYRFYTFGIDYKATTLVSSKFESKALVDSYRYEYSRNTQTQLTEKEAVTNKKVEPHPKTTNNPCQNPNLYVQVVPNGYCDADDRPAITIQCVNCQQSNWEFSVELRNANTVSDWQPLRFDGKTQVASGNAPRTEPLCAARPGVYYVRVLAKGENCPNPVIHNVGEAIAIADRSVVTESKSPYSSSSQIATNNGNAPILPDTCSVMARAFLYGNTIRGSVELVAGSPCSAFNPIAEVHYVHPGYRDIAAAPVQLKAGAIVPFEIVLDERDLNRNIQTIQIVTYIQPQAGQSIPLSSFWIKTGIPDNIAAKTPGNATLSASTNSSMPESFRKEELFETPSITQDIETISVKASDPNCTQLQDLSLVYMSGQPDKPLYISWLNPRCCQSDGCQYSIWAGENPDRLRILVDGSKRGSVIKELLPEMLQNDRYIEIVVNTSNGNRKAAYVLGEGPKYGIEEILAYRDRLNPQKSDALMIKKETNTKTGEVSGDLVARGFPGAAFEYAKPQNPIEDYQPCKYQRETMIVGDRPAEVGKKVMIQYDFDDKDYRYTLYLQPEGSNEWVIAPGTEELQKMPRFDLDIMPYHSGKYMILARKANSNWGCLAAPLEKALEVKVAE
ncbi:MAG: hypothetical protein IPJ74_23740 [Saprospiraceae bacterium]|nr:hypothetical protein [Saprospiraceae bacterium]